MKLYRKLLDCISFISSFLADMSLGVIIFLMTLPARLQITWTTFKYHDLFIHNGVHKDTQFFKSTAGYIYFVPMPDGFPPSRLYAYDWNVRELQRLYSKRVVENILIGISPMAVKKFHLNESIIERKDKTNKYE